MIPGTPKDLLCYFAGLTDMKFPVFLLICSLGRLPSLVTSTIGEMLWEPKVTCLPPSSLRLPY